MPDNSDFCLKFDNIIMAHICIHAFTYKFCMMQASLGEKIYYSLKGLFSSLFLLLYFINDTDIYRETYNYIYYYMSFYTLSRHSVNLFLNSFRDQTPFIFVYLAVFDIWIYLLSILYSLFDVKDYEFLMKMFCSRMCLFSLLQFVS